jgi:putative transposase
MPEYRRVRIHGATVFITFVTYDRIPILTSLTARQILGDVWRSVAKRSPFSTDAICLLPDHIHVLITLPEDDLDYSLRIREIKRLFTAEYLSTVGEIMPRNRSHMDKKEATIWQRRFWEHTIKDEQDYQNHFDYFHYNPVKHGLVKDVSLWAWSSFHRYVSLGVYDPGWGDGFAQKTNNVDFGE